MIKAIGLITVFMFSVLFGVSISEMERKQRAVCKEITDFLEYLSKEIHRKRPLNDIIRDYFSRDTGRYFRAASKAELICALSGNTCGGFAGELAVRTSEFLASIGKGADAELERESCAAFHSYAADFTKEHGFESTKRGMLCTRLGFMFGLALCIIAV